MPEEIPRDSNEISNLLKRQSWMKRRQICGHFFAAGITDEFPLPFTFANRVFGKILQCSRRPSVDETGGNFLPKVPRSNDFIFFLFPHLPLLRQAKVSLQD